MLIDWITARLPLTLFSPEQLQELQTQSDRVRRFDPKTGEVRYEMQAWDSARSDSHQVVFRVGSSDLWLQGSPARVCGDGCAVFGSGPSREMDITASLSRMIDLLFSVIGN